MDDSSYNKLTPQHIATLKGIVGDGYVFLGEEDRTRYGHDETEDLSFPPEVVVKPRTTGEVAAVMRLANAERIPVTPRGAGTGLSGGALPVHGGILLSMERFDAILDIDERNLQATVEPGVINQVFKDAVAEKGLFYPPDPASRGSCFLGGNLAENAGGPKALKYGVTRDYVLGCEVVLPTGDIIRTGARVLKNSTGYNLTQLMIGSEGTLGIITRIVFKLVPMPREDLLMLVPFRSPEKACEAVSAVFRAGITPSALEFMERDAIEYVLRYTESSLVLDAGTQAHLIVEVDGNDREVLFRDCERITAILEEHGAGEVMFADTAAQKNELWKIRRAAGEAVKAHSVYKEEDTVVPRAELPALLRGVKDIGRKYGFHSVCYGHAGDGNLHVNILKEGMSDSDWNEKLPLGIQELFALCVRLGGTISGEHGIGYVQRPYVHLALGDRQIVLQKGIKKLFDPNGILNPGKIFA